MKKQGTLSHWSTDFYENAFAPVPSENRKTTDNVLIVTMGYVTALSCFVIGARVGHALPLWQAILACVAGNLILMSIGILMGIMGVETGWSTTFLVRKMLGKHASMFVSGLIILLSIYWVGLNGDSFARMIVTAFPRLPIPIAVTAVILVILWGGTAAYGWRGLTMTSWILTPLTILLAVAGLCLMNTQINVIQGLRDFSPTGTMSITTAIAAVTGNYIFGCIISPDLCRFAKSRKAVVQVILPSYTIGFILLNICGVLIAQLGNSENFGIGLAKLGFTMPYLVCSAMSLWTTENINLYGGSLASQNFFIGTPVEGNLSHRLATWVLAGIAASFAALQALNYLMPIITLIAALIPPIPGILFAEYFVLRQGKKQSRHCRVQWSWIPAWILGGIAGIWSNFKNFLISPINALVVAGFVYIVLDFFALLWYNSHETNAKKEIHGG